MNALIVMLVCIIYMLYTMQQYKFCYNLVFNNDIGSSLNYIEKLKLKGFAITDDDQLFLKDLCYSITRSSKHSLFLTIIDATYSLIEPIHKTSFKNDKDNTLFNPLQLKNDNAVFEVKLLRFVHMVFYAVIVFFGFIIIPNLVFIVFKKLFFLVLYLMFLLIMIDFLLYELDSNFDISKIKANIYSNSIVTLIYNTIGNLIKYIN